MIFFFDTEKRASAAAMAVHVFPEAETTVITIADPPVLLGKVNVTLILTVVADAFEDEIATTVGAAGVVTFAAWTIPGASETNNAPAIASLAENFKNSP